MKNFSYNIINTAIFTLRKLIRRKHLGNILKEGTLTIYYNIREKNVNF